MPVPLSQIVRYCESVLKTQTFTDYAGAVNGLQVQNQGKVTHIAAAVDASHNVIQKVVATRADFLLVHHGLFWSPFQPWTGRHYDLLRLLFDHNLAVYSSHLPLDAHPRLGNNRQLANALTLGKSRPFFFEKGRFLGLQFSSDISRKELAHRLAQATGTQPIVIPGGPERCRRIGIVTGGAGEQLGLAASEGVDTFITGEGKHWTFALAEDAGINVLYGGHYATETFGVKALAAHLAKKFQLTWEFIDHPTGL